MLIGGIILTVLSVILAVRSMAILTRANPNSTLPLWWGRPQNSPPRAFTLRAVAAGVSVLGALAIGWSLGWWATPIVVIAMALPPLILQLQHNSQVQR